MKKRISLTKIALLVATLLCLVVGFVLLGSSNVKEISVANAEAVTEHGYGENLVIQPSPTKGQDDTGFKVYSGAGRIYSTIRNIETSYKDEQKTIVDYEKGTYHIYYGKPGVLDTTVICSKNFINLTSYDFSSGEVYFLLQAGLGGWKSYEGIAKAWVQFYDQNSDEDDPIALSSEIVGPTLEERRPAPDKDPETLIFTKKLIDETVPVGTKYAKVFVSFNRTTKEINSSEGMARDINFKIADYEIINKAPKADKDVNGGYLDIDSEGRNVTLNAIVNPGFKLVKYYVNGVETDVNTFVAEGDSVEVDATFEILPLKFDEITMSLENNLKMNFKVEKELNLSYTDLQVKFTFNGASTTVTDYLEEEDYLVFEFANIGIQQMGDEITAELSGKVGGSTYTTTKVYSVKEYCYDLLTIYPTVTLVRTLAVDTLNLGAAAQVFYNYKTSSLVNAGLTTEQKGWATPVREYNKEYGRTSLIDNPRTAVTALQLYAENNNAIDLQIGINFCGTGVTGYEEGDYIEIVMPGKSGVNTWQIAVSDLVNTTVDYKPGATPLNFDAGYFKGLNATLLSENMSITVYDVSGNAVSDTVRYSIENYCAHKYDASDSLNPGLAKFAQAVMSYGDSARAYAASLVA